VIDALPYLGILLLIIAGARLGSIYSRGREPTGTKVAAGRGESAWVCIDRHKGQIRKVSAAYDIDQDLSFSLYRENWFDGLMKVCGIARELQTGDVPFDGRVFIQSEDPALHDALLRNRDLRNQLFHLMRDPSTLEVNAANRRLWVVSTAYGRMKEREDSFVASQVANDFLDAVLAARPELAKVRGGETDVARDPTRPARRLIAQATLACLVLGIAGLVYLWRHLDHQVVLDAIPRTALMVALSVLAALLVLVWLTLGATAFTHRVVLDIIIAAVPAAWVAGFGGALWVNESYDTSPARHLSMPIDLAFQSDSRKNPRWYLRASAWPDRRARDRVEISRWEYTLMSGRRCVDIVWRGGRLGDGWVEAYQASPMPTCDEGVER